MEHILHGLNPAQKAAVTSQASVLQVLAPPGSGKTKTLTARAAYLIAHHGFQPRNIVVCTFTNKAAREMGERICHFLGKDVARKLILGTFHSIARRFLKQHGKMINLSPEFGIADTSDTKSIITRIAKRLKYTNPPGAILGRISKLKSQSITSDLFLTTNKSVEQQEFARIYTEYEAHLRVSNLLDFDDLVLRCAELLRRFPGCVSDIQAVLIDEFQDTNNVQYELMELFAQGKEAITIVGDPDQSIYGWRNAEIKNLNKMKQRFPDTHVINLEENYRSSGAILIAAQEVIEQDQSRPPKKLSATHSIGVQPVLRKLPSTHAEASWVVSEIQRASALTAGLLNWSDYAVLLRSASLSRLVETALGKAGIPYRMVGGHRFFDRIEVKLVLDYLRVISLPNHNDAVARVINVPPRGVGEKTVQYLLEEAEEDKVPLWTIITKSAQGRGKLRTQVSKQAEQGILTFFDIVVRAQKKLAKLHTEDESLADFLTHLVYKIDLAKHIRNLSKQEPEEFESRWANIQELITQAAEFTSDNEMNHTEGNQDQPETDHFQDELPAAEDALSKFLGNVALATDATVTTENGPPKAQVTLSTIHAAKGLEWPVVFIPSAYEGSIPHSRAEDNDEERRLLYVAMTRAQAILYMSCPTRNSNKEKTSLSPFLSDIPADSYFAKCGPELKFDDVKQLATILRRSCPAPRTVEAVPATLEFPRDNQWPLSGEYKEERQSWEMGADIDEAEYEARIKRHKAESGSFTSARKNFSFDKKTPIIQTAPTSTMNNRQAYSVSTATLSTGFVTAANVEVVEPVEPSRSAISINVKDPEKKRRRNMVETTQGSITTFFTKAPVAQPDTPDSILISSDKPLRYMTAREHANITNTMYNMTSRSATLTKSSTMIVQEHQKTVTGIRPSTTLHTTTIPQSTSVGPRGRTLGLRGPLRPWSARNGMSTG